MLKLLLVCAVVDIGFEVGFAEDNHERKTGKFHFKVEVPLITHSTIFQLISCILHFNDNFIIIFVI